MRYKYTYNARIWFNILYLVAEPCFVLQPTCFTGNESRLGFTT